MDPKDKEVPQQPTQEPQAEEETTAAAEEAAEDETGPIKPGSKLGKLKNMHMPKLQKPDFKRPEFTKKMPKLKAPDMSKFKRPEMPKFLTEKPDFSKMKSDFAKIKLARSKSMKEASPSGATSAASPSDASMMGDAPTTKVNYTRRHSPHHPSSNPSHHRKNPHRHCSAPAIAWIITEALPIPTHHTNPIPDHRRRRRDGPARGHSRRRAR